MKMEKHKNIEMELLSRYCEGKVTEEECRQVEEWMSQSDENRQMVKQVHALYLATDTINILTKVDTEHALIKVKDRMIVNRKISWREWAQRVAAALFIPLFITSLVQHFDNESLQMAQMIEVKTNPGMTTSIVLPDSTVVHLNSESSLIYPSYFSGDTRKVTLNGEAYFDVTKDATKRFIVSTAHQSQIEVLGTSFNIEAYERDSYVSTTLVEGRVNFSFAKSGGSKCLAMIPNQKVIYDAHSGKVQLLTTSCESEIAWKNGEIIFHNTPLDEALHMLERRYNVEFLIKNSRLKESAFTGTFTTQRLERILEYFKISSNIRWRYIDITEASGKKSQIEIY